MPFPVVNHSKYMHLGFSVGVALVNFILFSGSMLTTIIPLQPISDLELLETFSHFLLPRLLDLAITDIDYKFSRLMSLTSIAIFVLKNSSNKINIFWNWRTWKDMYGGELILLKLWARSTDKLMTINLVTSKILNYCYKTSLIGT